jgi:transposase
LARRIDEGQPMSRFVEGVDRSQSVLFPERLEDYVGEDNPVRVVDAFVEHLDLTTLGFDRAIAQATGRPGYHPATLLKIYLYGYLNRVQSSRRLEREAQRNVELMWLTGQLAPDFKTIADFRRDNGAAIRKVCREFVLLCRRLGLLSQALVAIDGSKFKAVNTRDKNYTRAKVQRHIEQIEESVARYLSELDTADRRQFYALRACRSDRHNIAFRLTQPIQIIRPSLHHLAPLGQMRGAVVGAAVRIAYCMRKLVLDVIGPKPQVLI